MFITFEGIDNSGKTTQIKLLGDYLRSLGHNVVQIKEPGSTQLGQEIRNITQNAKYDIDPMANLLLFNAARMQLNTEIILPALLQNKIVICDRYVDSTVTYQGAEGLGAKNVNDLVWQFGMTAPDMTFFLDIPVEVAIQRKAPDSRLERKGINFMRKVYRNYKEFVIPNAGHRITVIDATESIEKIQENIQNELRKYFIKHPRT